MDGRAGRSIWIIRQTETCGHGALPRDCGDLRGSAKPVDRYVVQGRKSPCRFHGFLLLRARWWRGDIPSSVVVAGSRRCGFFRFVASSRPACRGCHDIQPTKPSCRICCWQVPSNRASCCTHDLRTMNPAVSTKRVHAGHDVSIFIVMWLSRTDAIPAPTDDANASSSTTNASVWWLLETISSTYPTS